MKRLSVLMLAAALIAAACTRTETPIEEPENTLPKEATTIKASIDNGETRTEYTVDEGAAKAFFSWKAGDQIDAVISYGGGQTFSPVRFVTTESGTTAEFKDGAVSGDLTVAELLTKDSGAALSDWAFYPSRIWDEALGGGYAYEWVIGKGEEISVDLPSKITPPQSNPLAIVPLVGKMTGGEYLFVPATGVLGIKVNNIPAEVDFLSLKSADAALSGSFQLVKTTAAGKIDQDHVLFADPSGITLSYSGLPTSYTFYVPVPEGTIPAGLTVSVGVTADPDATMTVTTKKPIEIEAGVISMCPELSFKTEDQKWQKVADGLFLDDFLWSQHSAYTAGTWVDVTVEQSQIHPEKFRINNPYTVANAVFGYTPYVTGIVADDYLTFILEANDMVSYRTFRTGIEDDDSSGHPTMITYSKNWSSAKTGSESKVIKYMKSGLPLEIQLGAVYSDPDDASRFFTRDGEGNNSTQRIHIKLIDDSPETWTDAGTAEFLDSFIWGRNNNFTSGTYVSVALQKSDKYDGRYRIANPYLAAAAQFSYSIPSGMATGDEFMVLDIAADGKVTFPSFTTGVNLDASKSLTITHPTEWASYGGNAGDAANNLVTATTPTGEIATIQLQPIFHETGNYLQATTANGGYYYPPNGSRILYINFPVTETWTPVLDGTFKDDLIWGLQGFATPVAITLEQSSLNPGKFRIANPYKKAIAEFGYTTYTSGITGDDYIFFTIDDSGDVAFTTFFAGIEDKPSGGKPMKVWYPTSWGSSYSTYYNQVIATRYDGLPQEIQLSAVYSGPTTAEYSYKYTQVQNNLLHLVFPMDTDPWTDVCDVQYKDDFIINNRLGYSADTYTTVLLQKDTREEGSYRINNPYPVLAADLGYTVPSYVSTPDDYMYLTIKSDGSVYFKELIAGINLDTKDLTFYHPADVSGKSTAKNKIGKLQSNGLPDYIQLAPIYRETGNASYFYSRDTYDNIIKIVFPKVVQTDAVVTHKLMPVYTDYHNPVAVLSLPEGNLESLSVKVSGIDPSKAGLRLYQGGWMDDSYVYPDSEGIVTMTSFNKAVAGDIDLNFYSPDLPLGAVITFEVLEAVVDGVSLPIVQDKTVVHYPGVRMNFSNDKVTVRNATEETVSSFRIPALVTTNAGTLIAAYDIRYASSADLQGDIDVGMKRSTDGGKTWSDLCIIMDMGEWGGLGEDLNGIGDPCLLVDETTGDIFCFAVWAHGHPRKDYGACLSWAGAGYDPADTPQLMMVKSSDDGLSWSAPINLTQQVKKYDWWMTFQGPGRGITMADGTLVVPIQHQEGSRALNSGIMYSTDHGLTWHTHNFARATTSESCVAEIEPGVLMLNMRDETNSRTRAVYTTSNLGRSWTAHSTDATIIEPTCMASMLHVNASDNVLGKDLLLFSNPHNSTTARIKMTIQASLDKGTTWSHSKLLDEGATGYSCLTMIDSETVGILYEKSTTNIVFQAIPLTEIVN